MGELAMWLVTIVASAFVGWNLRGIWATGKIRNDD